MKTPAKPKMVRLVPVQISQEKSRYDIRVGKRGTGKVLASFVAWHDSEWSSKELDVAILNWKTRNPEYKFVYDQEGLQ